jgi:chemotaxis protein CheX
MSEEITLVLEPRLTQQNAAALLATLQAHHGTPLTVDASAVKHIGAPAFELLLAAARSWKTAGVSFAVTTPSSAFIEGLGHIGLTKEEFSISEG